jgi:hypothetical protein
MPHVEHLVCDAHGLWPRGKERGYGPAAWWRARSAGVAGGLFVLGRAVGHDDAAGCACWPAAGGQGSG